MVGGLFSGKVFLTMPGCSCLRWVLESASDVTLAYKLLMMCVIFSFMFYLNQPKKA